MRLHTMKLNSKFFEQKLGVSFHIKAENISHKKKNETNQDNFTRTVHKGNCTIQLDVPL